MPSRQSAAGYQLGNYFNTAIKSQLINSNSAAAAPGGAGGGGAEGGRGEEEEPFSNQRLLIHLIHYIIIPI